MSAVMEEDIKRWTALRKAAPVLEIIQGKTTAAEVSRGFDLPPLEVEQWVEECKRGMENALPSNPLDIREEYERELNGVTTRTCPVISRRPTPSSSRRI